MCVASFLLSFLAHRLFQTWRLQHQILLGIKARRFIATTATHVPFLVPHMQNRRNSGFTNLAVQARIRLYTREFRCPRAKLGTMQSIRNRLVPTNAPELVLGATPCLNAINLDLVEFSPPSQEFHEFGTPNSRIWQTNLQLCS